jgi:hypothetical protein
LLLTNRRLILCSRNRQFPAKCLRILPLPRFRRKQQSIRLNPNCQYLPKRRLMHLLQPRLLKNR